MKKERKLSSRRVAAVQLQVQAIKLRTQGLGFEEIAKKLDLKHAGTAYNTIEAGLARMLKEPAEQLRKIMLLRCDERRKLLNNKLLKHIKKDKAGNVIDYEINYQAFDRLCRLDDFEARLTGLYKIELTHTGNADNPVLVQMEQEPDRIKTVLNMMLQSGIIKLNDRVDTDTIPKIIEG